MRLNEHIALSTSKALLVPYSAHHVPTYHEWMQDPELQAATASEPLSLTEEYDMQRSWRADNDKLTFIVCRPRNSNDLHVKGGIEDSPEQMIGDINLFLFEPEDEDEDDDGTAPAPGATKPSSSIVGEIELMIARTDLHRQGYGRAALVSFITYILDSWVQIATEYGAGSTKPRALGYLRVKINQSNARSIALFENVGFKQTAAGANYFGEVELRWQPKRSELENWKGWEEVRPQEYVEP